MFTGDSSEKLRIAPNQVQIDTTHFRPQAPTKSAHSRTPLAVNRTAVKSPLKKHDQNIHDDLAKWSSSRSTRKYWKEKTNFRTAGSFSKQE